MAGLARQALIVSASRFLNQGLMVISPVILVRLLTVEDFGRYREFLMYATLVCNLGSFSLANSLLYFVGLQPGGAWGYVRRIGISVSIASIVAVTVFALLDRTLPHSLIGDELWPCLLYVLFYVNVDFWEFLWVAQKRPAAVLIYTGLRLVFRIVVVIVAALLTRDVTVILWSMVALEGVRLLGSAYWWHRLASREESEPLKASWKEQLQFCIPSGIAVFVTTLNSSIGGMWIDQSLGEVALAQFVIAGYVIMVVYPLRNSVSDVLLPEMASLSSKDRLGWLPLWQRSIVLFAILLWPAAVVLTRYAELFLQTVFSEKYLSATVLFQMQCLLVALSCFDIALALRAVNKTSALLFANFLCVAVNVAGMALLVPRYGTNGAGAALVISSLAGLLYLLWVLAGMYQLRIRDLIPVVPLLKVAMAVGIAVLLTIPEFWTSTMGIGGAMISSSLFLLTFVLLLRYFHVAEAGWLIEVALGRFRARTA